MRRMAPMKPSAGSRWPTDVRRHVRTHQDGCLGPRVGMPGDCMGGLELDHVRVGGTGMKSKSLAVNGAQLCSWHHSIRTREGRTYRPRLLSLIGELHGECPRCQREHITEYGVPLGEGEHR